MAPKTKSAPADGSAAAAVTRRPHKKSHRPDFSSYVKALLAAVVANSFAGQKMSMSAKSSAVFNGLVHHLINRNVETMVLAKSMGTTRKTVSLGLAALAFRLNLPPSKLPEHQQLYTQVVFNAKAAVDKFEKSRAEAKAAAALAAATA